MKQKLSDDTRTAILKAYADGMPIAAIAAKFGVCYSYPTKLARRREVEMREPKIETRKA